MREDILSVVGRTPLVKLSKIFRNTPLQVYAKLEGFNPGGSIKDRPACNIIKQGIESGLIGPDTVIIESSSGNMGIGLAQACRYYGLRFICVVDAKTMSQNLLMLKTYGAEVNVITKPDPVTGEYLQARISRVQELARTIENSFWPNQYENRHNSYAHHQTMREIVEELGRVDYLFCATSTCGTLRGCSEYVEENQLDVKIIAVDAVGSVIFGGGNKKRLIPGHGAAIVPGLFAPTLATDRVQVTDLDCIIGCRRLVHHEAILVGGSSGAILTAFEKVKNDLPEDSVCALIFPDRGDRYLDTIYSNEWVEEHFGNVFPLWKDTEESYTKWLTATC